MKVILVLSVIFVSNCLAYSQSGRKGQTITVPVPPPEIIEPKAPTEATNAAQVTAQKNEDYRCTDDGSLARILETDAEENVDVSKKPEVRAQILTKPAPSYTKEARRSGVQGLVVLKVLLSSDGEISRIRVIRGLPAGLTENGIRAACKIKFKPAMTGGQAVSRWVTVEYVFRLAESSIFGL
jgi:TonB family protein